MLIVSRNISAFSSYESDDESIGRVSLQKGKYEFSSKFLFNGH